MMMFSFFQQLVRTGRARARFALLDAIVSAVAALLAWQAARLLWGHASPTFAAVAVVVCLAPGLPSHLKQTWSVIVGCTIGIVIGEMAWLLPEHHPMLRLGVSIFMAVLLGYLLSPTPVAAIQAAVSVLLVWAMGPAVAGEARLLDVLTGAVIGLVFSQVLVTANPLQTMSQAANRFLSQLGSGIRAMQAASMQADEAQANQALAQMGQAYTSLTALQTAVEQGDQASKWSLRGHWLRAQVHAQGQRYGRHAVRLYGASLLLGEGLARTLAHADGTAPAALQAKLTALVQTWTTLNQPIDKRMGQVSDAHLLEALHPLSQPCSAAWPDTGEAAQRWRLVDEYVNQVAQALIALFDAESTQK